MQKVQLLRYKMTLEKKRSDLIRDLGNRQGIAIEKTPDLLEETQLASERELAIRNLTRDSSLLRNVEQALERIADGTYGICLHCEEEIKPRRLEAVPWAAYCVRCQEAADRDELGGEEAPRPEALPELRAEAA